MSARAPGPPGASPASPGMGDPHFSPRSPGAPSPLSVTSVTSAKYDALEAVAAADPDERLQRSSSFKLADSPPGSPAPEPSPERECPLLPTTPGAEAWDPEQDAQDNAKLFYMLHLFKWFEQHRPKVLDIEACPVAGAEWTEAGERADKDVRTLLMPALAALQTLENADQARRSRQLLREPPTARRVAALGNCWAGRLLAQGAIGRVWGSVDKTTGKLTAVKTIEKGRLPRSDLGNLRMKLADELKIHRSLKHPHVVELLQAREYPSLLVFTVDYAAGGDLLSFLRDSGALSEDLARTMFGQLVSGVRYLHDAPVGIVHRDIKPENILLGENNVVKLADFGVAAYDRPRDKLFHELCGTPSYMAPELIRGQPYRGRPVDVWAMGVVLYAMLRGTLPFKGADLDMLRQLICTAPVAFALQGQPTGLTAEAQELLAGLLTVDPNVRWTLEDVATCAWSHRRGRSTSVGPRSASQGLRGRGMAADLARGAVDDGAPPSVLMARHEGPVGVEAGFGFEGPVLKPASVAAPVGGPEIPGNPANAGPLVQRGQHGPAPGARAPHAHGPRSAMGLAGRVTPGRVRQQHVMPAHPTMTPRVPGGHWPGVPPYFAPR